MFLTVSVSRMPLFEDQPDSPEDQLIAFVRWFFTRYRQDSLMRHLNRDMGNLKPRLLEKIVESVIRPEFENCSNLVAALLPPNATEATIRAHVTNIIAMCIAPMHGSELYELLYPEVPYDDREIERHREHAIQLILGGLRQEATRLAKTEVGTESLA